MIPIGPGRFSIELMPGVDLRFEMDGNKVESMIAEISDTFTLVYGPSE
jgi:hypothetical protein